MDALDPWKLADLYGVEVALLSALPIGSEIREHFTVARQDLFSGALVPLGNGAVIVENDSHPLARRRSTMGHELAHIFGEHKFGTSTVNGRGCGPRAQRQGEGGAESGAGLLIRSKQPRARSPEGDERGGR